MNKHFVDLRSDIVTRPDSAMRDAMSRALVGEDLFNEDPTVNHLESHVAEMLGKEAALFVPTGTMGNLIALKVQARHGEEVILEQRSHIYDCELAGLASFCGLLARPILGDDDGNLEWKKVRGRIRPLSGHRSRTRLVCLENTHNFAGGTVLDQEKVRELCQGAKECDLLTHLDGARLFNAAIAVNQTPADLAAPFDTVMVSFAKGLSAPAGAALAGTRALICRARSVRKLLGGSIHQPGILAAACLHGLEYRLPQLISDHNKARRLAVGIEGLPNIIVNSERVVTNMVIVMTAPPMKSDFLAAFLHEKGVFVNLMEDGRIRLVTHSDISEEDIDRAIKIFSSVSFN